MKRFARVARWFAVGAWLAFSCHAAAQQDYPNKPIRFISPFSPGGGTTTVARLIGQKLTEHWGQYVIVDNRPGGNTIIGSEALVRATPDGYTIMIHASTHAINPSLFKLPYDTIKDFAPITTVTSNEYMLVVHPSVAAANYREFIALAKSMPGKLNYATTGTGSTQHLATELLSIMTGIRMQHIPYKGGGPVMNALVGGQVQLAFTGAYNAMPYLNAGRLRAIAISGEHRIAALPQVPTFEEAGLHGFNVRNWYGLFAPAGTPKRLIDKLAGEIGRIMVSPDMEKKLEAIGLQPFVTGPEKFAAIIKADIAKYAKVIKTANIKLDY